MNFLYEPDAAGMTYPSVVEIQLHRMSFFPLISQVIADS